jgi:hypothetical protein
MNEVAQLAHSFTHDYSAGPLRWLDAVFAWHPDILWHAFAFFAFFFLVNDLLRTAVMAELPRSVLAHLTVCTLTLLPGIVAGLSLLWAAHRHPDRVWIDFGMTALLYPFWIAGGALTKLARADSEGTDIGWISHGAFINVVLGLFAVVMAKL